jgi:hypothetical protein
MASARKKASAPQSGASPAAPNANATALPDGQPERRAFWLIEAPWLAAFLLLVFLAGCVEIEDPDLWWHLRTGQLIWQRGEIPRTDWFTFTNPDSPWIDLHWGFQLFAAGLWHLGGAPALVLAKSALGVAAFGLLLLATRKEWSAARSVACWLPALVIFYGRNQVRPEMFSFVFLAAELLIAFHARRRPGLVWLWPLIQLVWINVHALFVLGVVIWCCFLAERTLTGLLQWRATRLAHGRGGKRSRRSPTDATETPEAAAPSSTDVRRWLIVSLLIAVAALANPYGLEGALFPLTLLERIEGRNHAFYVLLSGEFRGFPEFLKQYGWAAILDNLTTQMIALLFVAGIASFVPLLVRRRFDLFRALTFALFAHLCWQANRNSPLFALVGAFVLRANLGDWLETGTARSRRRFRLGRVALAGILGALIVLVPLDLLSVTRPGEMARMFGLHEIPNAFAHEEAEFLGKPGMPRSCYAIDEGAAAVFIYHNGPERRVFADPRLEVNTRKTLERYLRIEAQLAAGNPALLADLARDAPLASDGQPELPALLINLRVLVYNPAMIDGLKRLKQYRRVYEGKVAVVYLEVAQAERLGLPDIDASADDTPSDD